MPEIILRKEAREQGLTRYFTGKPCKNGHLEERNTNSGICYGCSRAATKKYLKTEKGKEKFKVGLKKYHQSEKGKISIKKSRQQPSTKASVKKYQQSEAGKISIKKYTQTESYKASIKKYQQTEAGKKSMSKSGKKYRSSEKGKLNRTIYEQTDNYKEKNKRYRESEKAKETSKKYRQSDNFKQKQTKYRNKKLSTVAGRMERNIRVEMFKVLKSKGLKKSQRLINLIGCGINELIEHLTRNFYKRKNGEEMTMDNYSKTGWHVDHIVPVNYFLKNYDYGNDKSIERICWHYTNLRPLWAEDNVAKSDKILEEEAEKKIAEIRKLINA